MKIGKNTVVTLHYKLKNREGELIESTEGKNPLVYMHGTGGMLPGLETKLEGRATGDTFTAVITPEEGFGERNEELVHEVPRSGFQSDSGEELATGMQVQLNSPEGTHIALVTAIEDDMVTLDLNHPLAGIELQFDIQVIELREATPEEIAHGHVHGPGGHHH